MKHKYMGCNFYNIKVMIFLSNSWRFNEYIWAALEVSLEMTWLWLDPFRCMNLAWMFNISLSWIWNNLECFTFHYFSFFYLFELELYNWNAIMDIRIFLLLLNAGSMAFLQKDKWIQLLRFVLTWLLKPLYFFKLHKLFIHTSKRNYLYSSNKWMYILNYPWNGRRILNFPPVFIFWKSAREWSCVIYHL